VELELAQGLLAIILDGMEALAVVEAIHQSEVMEQKLKATVVEQLNFLEQVAMAVAEAVELLLQELLLQELIQVVQEM
jgi:hypothetical protein